MLIFEFLSYIQMFEFILYLMFQELEYHAVDDIEFDDVEADILENVH